MDCIVARSLSRIVFVALAFSALSSAADQTAKESQSHQAHVMVADDTCRDRVNKPLTLRRGDEVEIYRSVQPSDPATKLLPPHDSLSMKVNRSYIRAVSGSNVGEYCWVATVNVR